MKFRPLHDKLLVSRINAPATSKGGIIIPEAHKEKGERARVFAAGPGKLDDGGRRLPMHVRVGDVVLLGKWTGSEIKLDGEDFLIISESEVLGIEE